MTKELLESSGILLLLSTTGDVIFANKNFQQLPDNSHDLSKSFLKNIGLESLKTGKMISQQICSDTEPLICYRIEASSVAKGVMLIGVDITELKRQEEKIRRNERLLSQTQIDEHIGVWDWNLTDGKVDWSEQLYKIFGISSNEHVPTLDGFVGLIHPEDKIRVRDLILKALKEQQPFSYDVRIIRADGSLRFLHSWGNPVFEKNILTSYVGVCQDFTDRMLSEDKFKTQEMIYQKIFENFDEGILAIDQNNLTTTVNRKMEEILGYMPGEMNNRPVYDFIFDREIKDLDIRISRRRQGIQEQYELVFRHKNDSKVWVLISGNPLMDQFGSYTGSVALVRDVSERKKREVLLLAQKNIFEILTNKGTLQAALSELVKAIEELIEGVMASVLILHEDGRRLITGSAPNLPPGFNEAIDELTIGPMAGSCGTAAYTKMPVIVDDITKDPRWINYRDLASQYGILSCWSTPIMDGKVLGTFALYFKKVKSPTDDDLKLVQDFTAAARLSIEFVQTREQEKKQKLHAALLSECRKELAETLQYNKILKKIPEIITREFASWCYAVVINDEGHFETVSKTADPQKEGLIKNFEYYLPDLNAKFGLPLALREKKALLYAQILESDLIPFQESWTKIDLGMIKQLGLRSMIVAPMVIRGKAIGGLVVVSSEPKKRFNQMDLNLIDDIAHSCAVAIDNSILYLESQRSVRAREDFISVASHELRTPLTSLKLRIDLLSKMMSKESFPPEIFQKLKPIVTELQPDLQKFAKLVETLLDISKVGLKKLFIHPSEADLSKAIDSEVQRLKPVFEFQNCPLRVNIEKNLFGNCDQIRIQQIISNLLSNACKFGDKKPVEFSARREGDNLIMKVRDHGIGILQKDIKRIFQPFERAVSDKNFGGLGLGLYITKQIIEGHDGHIEVESRPGEGTCFTVELPVFHPH